MQSYLSQLLQDQGLLTSTAELLGKTGGAVFLLLVALVIHWVLWRPVLALLKRLIVRTETNWDDALLENRVPQQVFRVVPLLAVYHLLPVVLDENGLLHSMLLLLVRLWLIVVGTTIVTALLRSVLQIYDQGERAREVPLKGFIQVLQILAWSVCLILFVSQLMGRSPLVLLSGLGAFAAVLMLVFRDAILGLVAGVQLAANRMVARGDWIEQAQAGADGSVIDVSLTTVKVQNWDKTIVTIPTYQLISGSFRNWRGMEQSGGRRIKRSIHIDQGSIRFLDAELRERLQGIGVLKEYMRGKLQEIGEEHQRLGLQQEDAINGRALTNIGCFRAWLQIWLRQHPRVHQDMTFLIRQLQPGPTGLPIEIYVFTRTTEWAEYEAIQADLFDRILAMVPVFGLKVFQQPSGQDLGGLVRELGKRD